MNFIIRWLVTAIAVGAAVWLVWFLLGNLPFILIQRYNRPRLLRLRSLLQRREQRKGRHEHTDTDL